MFEEDDDAHEWSQFLALWHKAEMATDANPRVIGEMHDTVPDDWTYITFIGGPRLRLVLRENGACTGYDIDRARTPDVDRAFAKITAAFAGKVAKPLSVSDQLNLSQVNSIVTHMWTNKPSPDPASCERLLHV